MKVGGFVADIVGENGIIETKRAGLTGWAANSTCFWKRRVTVAYPVPAKARVGGGLETGEIFEKRKIAEKGAAYDVFPELYKIKSQLMHLNFRCASCWRMTDYKYLDGYGKQRSCATRGERIPKHCWRGRDLREPRLF